MRHISLRHAAFAAGLSFVLSSAHATLLPVTKPNFSPVNVTNTFTYEGATYNAGDNLPNHLLTTDFANSLQLFDSHSGVDSLGTAKMNSYDLTGAGGVIRDTRDFTVATTSGGPAGYLSITGSGVSTLSQTLTGTTFQPFTQYTLTVTVLDRQFGATDQFSFPGKVTLTFTAGGNNVPGGTQTLADPVAGGKSTGTLVLTTGAVVPTGDFGFKFRIGQFQAGPGIVASEAVFDDITVDAVATTPEPGTGSLLGLAGLLAARRRRS